MKGFYFINTDISNTRAHTSQILNTVDAINDSLRIKIVAPKYHGQVNLKDIQQRHGLSEMPNMMLLKNFGTKKPSVLSFIIFNFPAVWFLFIKKFKKEVDFIYIRSSLFTPLVIFAYVFNVSVFYETHRKPMSTSEVVRDYVISKISSGIIVISEYMKKYYLKYNKKILVVHDAVSLKRFDRDIKKEEARRELNISLDAKVCVYTGTVSKLKGIDYVFKVAYMMPEVVFILAGQVSEEFKDLNLPSNIQLLGKRDNSGIPSILKSADILLLPHPKGEYSQSPMKLFEYMASDVPIVASRLPSISEVLNDENAVLVEPESVNSLKQGIKKVFENKNFSAEIAKKAYNDIQNYTWEKRGMAITEFINKTIQNL